MKSLFKNKRIISLCMVLACLLTLVNSSVFIASATTIEQCKVTLHPDGTLYKVSTVRKGRHKEIDLEKLAMIDMEAYVLERLGGKDDAPQYEIKSIALEKNQDGKHCLTAYVETVETIGTDATGVDLNMSHAITIEYVLE